MKLADKLRAYWSKRQDDIMLHFPMGYGIKCDGHYLSGIFSREFEQEMTARGYDIKTLRFSIEPQAGNEKFRSQRETSN